MFRVTAGASLSFHGSTCPTPGGIATVSPAASLEMPGDAARRAIGRRVVGLRALTLGVVGPDLLWRAAYLAVLGLVGLFVAGRRLAKLLLI